MPFDLSSLFANFQPVIDTVLGFIQEILSLLFGTGSPFA
jgi:hypothetical protein